MPSNLLLYPLDDPPEITGDADNSFALDNAVETLELQARDTAVRQAHTRRISGQNDIQNQNGLVKARDILMPLAQIGPQQVVIPTIQGTIVYLSGGKGHGYTVMPMAAFTFSNESALPTGIYMVENRTYQGAIFNQFNGYFCGGSGLNGVSQAIDSMNYSKGSVKRTAVTLSQARQALAGIGNKNVGVLAGGAIANNTLVKTIDIVNYGTLSAAAAGTSLGTARIAPHNGTATSSNGYFYGGCTNGGQPNVFNVDALLTSIEAYSFIGQSMSTLGTALSRSHLVHATFGNTIKAYIAGGINSISGAPTADISTFTYSGQTAAVLGSSLPENKICSDGAGSSAAGYGFGGTTSTAQVNTSIDKINYADERVYRLGTQLPYAMADQGAVSDYAASLY